MAGNEKTCFVVCPIGAIDSPERKRSDQVLKHIIEPICGEAGYSSVIRADKISDPGSITRQIILNLLEADLVVADLTGLNPNVFYELALRHATAKPYVQLCDVSTKIPFDIATQRTIMFDYRDLDSVEFAKEELAKSIEALQRDPNEVMTPIHESLRISSLQASPHASDRVMVEILDNISRLSDQVKAIENRLQTRWQSRRESINREDPFAILHNSNATISGTANTDRSRQEFTTKWTDVVSLKTSTEN